MTNKQVVVGFFKALDENDFDTAKKFLAPGHLIYSSMKPGPVDADEHLAVSRTFHDSFSNAQHELVDFIEEGNKVATRATWNGVHTGTFNGIPATGKTVHLSFITICEIENDAIKNQWLEMDVMSMMKQMEVIPAQAHA